MGPYGSAVLRAEEAEPLFDWLVSNGYDLPPETSRLVEPLVLMGDQMHFVAFRLSRGA